MVTAIGFNPDSNIGVIASSYLDGELVLIDSFDDQELESFRADCHTLAAKQWTLTRRWRWGWNSPGL